LALGLLAIRLVLLYWRATRVPRLVVTTDWLWEKALAEERLRARWQKYRTGASLALHLIVLGLVTIAVAGPLIPGPRYVAIIVDNGRTMQAKDGTGTRLDAAKSKAREIVASLRECDKAIVFSCAGQPSQQTGMTSDRETLLSAIDGIAASDVAPAMEWAVATVERVAIDQAAKIEKVVITDGCSGDSKQISEAPGVRREIVGTSRGHVSITRLSARMSVGLDSLLVELQNQGDADARGRLEFKFTKDPKAKLYLQVDGKPLEGERGFEIIVPKNGRYENQLTIQQPAVGTIEVRFASNDKSADDGLNDQTASVIILLGDPPTDDVTYAPGTSRSATSHGVDLRVPPELKSNVPGEYTKPAPLPLWIYPAGLALVLMVIEWCLYQQRWLC